MCFPMSLGNAICNNNTVNKCLGEDRYECRPNAICCANQECIGFRAFWCSVIIFFTVFIGIMIAIFMFF